MIALWFVDWLLAFGSGLFMRVLLNCLWIGPCMVCLYCLLVDFVFVVLLLLWLQFEIGGLVCLGLWFGFWVSVSGAGVVLLFRLCLVTCG